LTESLCPVCLKPIPASRVTDGDDVYLAKTCPEHGGFRSIIWRGPPDYASWSAKRPPDPPVVAQTATERGCPLDCGLCPAHRQQTCCVLLEVTSRCDLRCPVCFASSGDAAGADPDLDEIDGWLRVLSEQVGYCNLQLSGGEPALRDDLPEIIALGRRRGFSFFQLNTNGLRLASETGYAQRLAAAGLLTVFLQFDGLGDDVYRRLRGRPLFAEKEAAIAHCAAAGLGVVLVPTLVPRVNTDQVGMIIDYALRLTPTVRGVHFQPISYFGRYPRPPADGDRYTLPELLRAVETQTGGRFPVSAFQSSGCGHSLCSFSGDFLPMADGSLRPLSDRSGRERCCAAAGSKRAVERQRSFIARRWSAGADRAAAPGGSAAAPGGSVAATAGSAVAPGDPPSALSGAALRSPPSGTAEYRLTREDPPHHPDLSDPVMSLDDFLERVRTRTFTITAMAFQDVWTLDLERLRHCHLHVVAPGGRIVPFCAYNLTDVAGNPLHRGVAARPAMMGTANAVPRAPAPGRPPVHTTGGAS